MKCPQCQQENPPQSNFCLGCGRRLALACVSCGNDLAKVDQRLLRVSAKISRGRQG